MEKLMLRPAEAADLIGFARTTMYKLIREEQIPFCRVGKSIRISVEALKAWAERKGMGVSPTVPTRRQVRKTPASRRRAGALT